MSFCTIPTSVRDREDGTVYFFGDTSQHNWAGVLDYHESMTETALAQYVENERPDLFKQLHGLRLGCSDLSFSYYGQRTLEGTAKVEKQASTEAEEHQLHPSLSAFQIEGTPILHSSAHLHVRTSRLKDYVLNKIQNGYTLSLLRRKPDDLSLICAAPACRYASSHEHYLALHPFAMSEELQKYHHDSPERIYCLHCIEEAFDIGTTSCEESHLVSRCPWEQGIDHKRILQAAQRLHPSNEWHGHHIETAIVGTNKSETELLTVGLSDETRDKDVIASPPVAHDRVRLYSNDAESTTRDLEDTLAIMPWGIPVNKPSKSESVVIACPEVERDSFGVAAPSSMSVDPGSATELTDSPRYSDSDASIFHFSDLAPFIHAVDLSHRESELVEAWRNTRPKSKLWPRMNRSSAAEVLIPDHTELTQLEREALSIKLSEILEDI